MKPAIGIWRVGSRGARRERDDKETCHRGHDGDVNAIRRAWRVLQQWWAAHDTRQNAPYENSIPRWHGPGYSQR